MASVEKVSGFMSVDAGVSDAGSDGSEIAGSIDLGRFAATIVAVGFIQAALFVNSQQERSNFAASIQVIFDSVEQSARRTARVDITTPVHDAIRIAFKPYSSSELIDLFAKNGILSNFGGLPTNRQEAVAIGSLVIGKRIAYKSAMASSAVRKQQ